MAIAFVMISSKSGHEHNVYDDLLKVKEIVELHPLFGEYDLIAKLDVPDFNALGNVVVNKIRTVPYVKETTTLTGANI